uniref:Large ribosomal subunit protein bL12 C-terminal domain-containing protein n=1 Tax=Araucaria cunninghamii TaxID=56994 RepID=A0A0D6R2J8_ARACU
MYSKILLRNLGNHLNSRATLGFLASAHEVSCFRAAGFSSTGNPENQAGSSRNPKLERIADEFLSLNILERSDFQILFRLKLGLDRFASPMAGGMLMPGASAGAGAAAATEKKGAEKTTFNVKLEKYDASAKIKIIKEVRAFTDLGLKEAKELVEKAPAVLKKGLTKEEADKLIEKFKELGATAVME